MRTTPVALLLLIFISTKFLTNQALVDSEYSFKPAQESSGSHCLPIEEPSCLGLEYTHTYLPNLIGLTSQSESTKRIHDYAPLLKLGCSSYLEFFLCSVYFPMCAESMGEQVLLRPCASFCNHVKHRCSPLMLSFNFLWPDELECSKLPSDDEMCIRPHSFEADARLTQPSLIPNRTVITEPNKSCSGEFTIEEKAMAKYVLVAVGSFNAIFCLISVSLYMCNRNRFVHPLKPMIFLIHASMVEIFSFFPQLLFRRDVFACGYGTMPDKLTNIACLSQFAIAYYARMVIGIWFTVLSLSWFLSACKSWAPEAIRGLDRWFHILAWVLPIFPTTFFLIFQKVEVDELTNSCYIGFANKITSFMFAILPEACSTLIGVAFLSLTLASLLRMYAELKSLRPVSTVTIKTIRTPANRRRLLKAVNRVIFTVVCVAGPMLLGLICDLWRSIDNRTGQVTVRILKSISLELVGIGATLVLWFNQKSLRSLCHPKNGLKSLDGGNFIHFQTLNPITKGEFSNPQLF
ncbi:hypothetical protein Aperf_G00000009713 [Anoplocephala perfoliata]